MNLLRYSKILIVDDSKAFRVKIKSILIAAEIGYCYFEAKDGQEAISQYITNRPHLTIMDLNMPNVGGIQASQAIKKFDPNAKIIIISTRDNQETIDAVIKKGLAKDYVFKPCDTSAIAMAVSKQLVKNRNSSL